MKTAQLASELRKVSYSDRLAFADFLTFDDFLMFLNLVEFSSVSSALPSPKLSTSLFLTAIVVGSSFLTIQLVSSSTSSSSTPSPDRVEFFDDPADELL